MQEIMVESSSQIKLNENVLDYKTVAGTLVLKDEQGADRGSIFYTAYFLKNQPSAKRPITFCFNGGPGAGSVWLNLGFIGPKELAYEDLDYVNPPYHLIDNNDTLLPETDLVFIDPIPSGYSTIAPGKDIKQFLGLEEDVSAMCDFVRLFTSKYKRWDSPKYLLGESYGGMRISKMAYRLHDYYGLYLNGLIFISPALDLMTIASNELNELPYLLAIPSYAATKWYHQKDKKGALDSILKNSEAFVLNDYAKALFEGDRLPLDKQTAIAKQLENFTGVDQAIFQNNSLKLETGRFNKELLRDQGEVVGRFDARKVGFDLKYDDSVAGYDPSLESIYGAMTAAFSQYLLKDLKWPEQKEYKALSSHIMNQWNWGKPNCYASCLGDLKKLMIQNPKLQIFTAVGVYDLATPYFATEYALFHLNNEKISPKRIQIQRYEAGHMMYMNKDIKKKLKKDLEAVYSQGK